MNPQNSASYGALLLRVSLGVMFLAHSVYLKALVFTLPGTAQFFQSIGLPGPLAYAVFAVEAIGGILLIAGYRTREVSLVLLPVLIGAAWTHWPNGWLFTAPNGGWEYPVFLVMATAVQALIGDGAYSISRLRDNQAAVGEASLT